MNAPNPSEAQLVSLVFRPALRSQSFEGQVPPDDFVVSRYSDGRIASRYADLVWDWTPYAPSGKRAVLNFQFWPQDAVPTATQRALVAEMQWLLYLFAWKRPGPLLSYQTLLHYVKTLRAVSLYYEAEGKSLQAVFTSHVTLLDAVNALPPVHSKQLSGLLAGLAEIGPKVVGYAVLGKQSKVALRRLAREYTESLRQRPPLPTRIYSHVIGTLTQELSDFEQVADRYIALAERCAVNPLLGRTKSIQWSTARRKGIERDGFEVQFSELVVEYGLAAYFSAKGLSLSVFGVSTGLSRLQAVCRLAIHVFSGMRDEEVGQLAYTCLESTDKPRHSIVGATTKLNRGKPKVARWVTSSEGARAIQLARRLTELCWRVAGAQALVHLPALEDTPLFVSTAYLGLAGQLPAGAGDRLVAAKFDFSGQPELRTLLQPVITEQDLLELEQIDPHRAWRAEAKFQPGKPWTLTTHQLRRSLALYAQRSGLVSLPSLRRQLQHLTEEMSRYYAKGSAFADDFIGRDKNHFGNEWREMQPVSSALSYILNVLTTNEVLFGAHGNWVEHRLHGKDGALLVDRETTIKRFKKGELAYKETLLGGCTSTERCDIQPIKWLNVDCVKGCKNMVGRASKLDRVIAAQTRLVETLDKTTPEFRTEQADLQVLLSARKRVQNRLTESTN